LLTPHPKWFSLAPVPPAVASVWATSWLLRRDALQARSTPCALVDGQPEINNATSLRDFLAKHLALTYVESRNGEPLLPPIRNSQQPISRQNSAVTEVAKLAGFTGGFCDKCGSAKMIRSGACLSCTECGANTGCS
jgi:hypothetical protein